VEGTKTTAAEKLIALVTRKQGVTHAEACEELGWKQCRPYLIKVCDAAKIILRKQRKRAEASRSPPAAQRAPNVYGPGRLQLFMIAAGEIVCIEFIGQ